MCVRCVYPRRLRCSRLRLGVYLFFDERLGVFLLLGQLSWKFSCVPWHLCGITASVSCLANRRRPGMCLGEIWMRDLTRASACSCFSTGSGASFLGVWDAQPGASCFIVPMAWLASARHPSSTASMKISCV